MWLLTLLALTGAGNIESRVTARVVSRRIEGDALNDDRLLRRDAVLVRGSVRVGRDDHVRSARRIYVGPGKAGVVKRCSVILGTLALLCFMRGLTTREQLRCLYSR